MVKWPMRSSGRVPGTGGTELCRSATCREPATEEGWIRAQTKHGCLRDNCTTGCPPPISLQAPGGCTAYADLPNDASPPAIRCSSHPRGRYPLAQSTPGRLATGAAAPAARGLQTGGVWHSCPCRPAVGHGRQSKQVACVRSERSKAGGALHDCRVIDVRPTSW